MDVQQKTLTVVIPAYNIESYVDKVLSSLLLRETEDKVEVLLIDDGSTDATVTRANLWAEKHPSLRIVSKGNGGHGSVINEGILQATGKYFRVVDGDDFVEKDGYIRLIGQLECCDADLVLNPYYTVNCVNGKKKLQYGQDFAFGEKHNYDDIYQTLGRIPMHTMTVRTAILKENNIRLTEHCYYDDFQYTMYTAAFVQTVAYFDEPVYDYVIGQEGQSVDPARTAKNAWMLEKVFGDSAKFLKGLRGLTPEKKASLILYMMSLLNNLYNVRIRGTASKDGYQELRSFHLEMQKNHPGYVRRMMKSYPHIRLAVGSAAGYRAVAGLLWMHSKVAGGRPPR